MADRWRGYWFARRLLEEADHRSGDVIRVKINSDLHNTISGIGCRYTVAGNSIIITQADLVTAVRVLDKTAQPPYSPAVIFTT